MNAAMGGRFMPGTGHPERQSKKSSVTPEEIGHFLAQTGFVFEMRTNDVFLRAGYTTLINAEFFDLEKGTLREIDLIASKTVNEVNINFVIECKQSATDKWIFMCNKRMPRFYRAVKQLPHVDIKVIREKRLFECLPTFDPTVPLPTTICATRS
jgi:hypothetical protein